MSRPSKKRRICDEPVCRVFGPCNLGYEDDTESTGDIEITDNKDIADSKEIVGNKDIAVNKDIADVVSMTVDEYESIRLIDLEALSQEECANRMNVARTTAQAIYASARTKLADCIVNGKTLQIAGGNYVVCDGSAGCSESCKHS